MYSTFIASTGQKKAFHNNISYNQHSDAYICITYEITESKIINIHIHTFTDFTLK